MALMLSTVAPIMSELVALFQLWGARLVCLALLLVAGVGPGAAQPVNGFFDQRQGAVNPDVGRFRDCARPPPPVVNYADVDFCVNEAITLIFWDQRCDSLHQARPVREYAAFVQRIADSHFTARRPDTATAQCVARCLLAWAQKGVLDALDYRSHFEKLALASLVDAIGNFSIERGLGAFEIYLSLEQDARVEALARARRPASSPPTGGDWSFSPGRSAEDVNAERSADNEGFWS